MSYNKKDYRTVRPGPALRAWQEFRESQRTHSPFPVPPYLDFMGLKRNSAHAVTGDPESGKSTVAKTLIKEALYAEIPVFLVHLNNLYLTDETKRSWTNQELLAISTDPSSLQWVSKEIKALHTAPNVLCVMQGLENLKYDPDFCQYTAIMIFRQLQALGVSNVTLVEFNREAYAHGFQTRTRLSVDKNIRENYQTVSQLISWKRESADTVVTGTIMKNKSNWISAGYYETQQFTDADEQRQHTLADGSTVRGKWKFIDAYDNLREQQFYEQQ